MTGARAGYSPNPRRRLSKDQWGSGTWDRWPVGECGQLEASSRAPHDQRGDPSGWRDLAERASAMRNSSSCCARRPYRRFSGRKPEQRRRGGLTHTSQFRTRRFQRNKRRRSPTERSERERWWKLLRSLETTCVAFKQVRERGPRPPPERAPAKLCESLQILYFNRRNLARV